MPDKFSIEKKGYNKHEVDMYIANLEAIIKSYKEKDSAIKNAIINAQLAADNIVNEAETKTERIYQDTINKLDTIQESVSVQKSILKEFQNDYNILINRYVHQINEQDIPKTFEKINELESFLSELRKPSEDNQ